jgi:hypothetical protein
LANGEAAGVYIFHGVDGMGKGTVANYFAQLLLCQGGLGDRNIVHGDFHDIEKEKDKKNISIERVREFIRTISMSSFLNSYKVGIIKDAHLLSEEAANALLKTLEEPNAKVVIILITSDIERLPATVVSRGQILRFHPVKADLIYDYLLNEKKAPRSLAKNFSRLSLGRPALAVKFLEDKDFYEDYLKKAKVFLNFFSAEGARLSDGQGSASGGKPDINERLVAIEDLIGKKATGQEAAARADDLIEIWEGVARDFLLANVGQLNLIRHHLAENELEHAAAGRNVRDFINLADNLRRAREYLRANVNAKTVLEQIAINI